MRTVWLLETPNGIKVFKNKPSVFKEANKLNYVLTYENKDACVFLEPKTNLTRNSKREKIN